MNKENIEKVITFLRQLHPKNFDLFKMIQDDGCDPSKVKEHPELDCGTAGCVYGYFPAIFPERFYWEKDPYDGYKVRDIQLGGILSYKMAEMLGVSRQITMQIAYPQYYDNPTKEAVIERLEQIRDGKYESRSY